MNLLNHLIISRKDIKYNIAKMKWERDVEFTENYKVNPERFIIAD